MAEKPVFRYPPDIEAEITFVAKDKGGRKIPALSGYRPQFYYNGHDWDATHEYPDVDSVLPGETVRTLLRFLSPEMHIEHLYVGMQFQCREGARTVAVGKITKILDITQSVERSQTVKRSGWTDTD